MPLFQAIFDRLTGRDIRKRFAQLTKELNQNCVIHDQNTDAYDAAIEGFDSDVKLLREQVDHLLHNCPTDYCELADRLAAVEKRAAGDRAKLDALDEYARSLPTEDDVIKHIEGSEYCTASNLAARLRNLADAVERDRDFEATQEDLEAGVIQLVDGTTLADLGLDDEDSDADHEPDAEGDTEPFLPAVAAPEADHLDPL